jgi:hypothetical protein
MANDRPFKPDDFPVEVEGDELMTAAASHSPRRKRQTSQRISRTVSTKTITAKSRTDGRLDLARARGEAGRSQAAAILHLMCGDAPETYRPNFPASALAVLRFVASSKTVGVSPRWIPGFGTPQNSVKTIRTRRHVDSGSLRIGPSLVASRRLAPAGYVGEQDAGKLCEKASHGLSALDYCG